MTARRGRAPLAGGVVIGRRLPRDRAGARGALAGAALGLALVVGSAIGLVPALAPAAVAAATPSLSIVGAATYDVLPDEGRIAVKVDLTATNHLKDTVTTRFSYRVGYVTVLPGTSNFKLTAASGKPKVTVSSATDTYTNLKLDFGANLAAGKSTALTLTFDIRDAGGAPDRAVRISRSLVTFSAWAVATPSTPGGTVDVRLPEGYSVSVGRGPLAGPTPDGTGHDVWSSGTLAAPLDFVADLVADRSSDYAETTRTVAMSAGSATILLRAWPDDPAWRDRIAALVQKALPVLEREIGIPWPANGQLAVHEALPRSTGGYAGLYDPGQRLIEIAYSASDGVVLHELAHAWFNGGLVADRWAAEGFASYYAELAARELGVEPAVAELPGEPSPDAIPLNDWGISGTEVPGVETWAYAASLAVARQIAARAGEDGLRAVWAKASGGIAAYQGSGAGTSEPAADPPDWRGLLDLLEEGTGKAFADLWTTWVARPADLPALADRAATRAMYQRTVATAGDWRLPASTRMAMRAWRFDVARELLTATDAVLAQRDALQASAAAADATLPGTLRATFEGTGGLAAAAAEAQAEQATVDAIAAARAARPTEQGPGEGLIVSIGLLLSDPQGRLDAALRGLAAGDLQTAYTSAQVAETVWSGAAGVGRSRIVSTALLLLALALFAGIVRGRRRSTPASPTQRESPSEPGSPTDPTAPD